MPKIWINSSRFSQSLHFMLNRIQDSLRGPTKRHIHTSFLTLFDHQLEGSLRLRTSLSRDDVMPNAGVGPTRIGMVLYHLQGRLPLGFGLGQQQTATQGAPQPFRKGQQDARFEGVLKRIRGDGSNRNGKLLRAINAQPLFLNGVTVLSYRIENTSVPTDTSRECACDFQSPQPR